MRIPPSCACLAIALLALDARGDQPELAAAPRTLAYAPAPVDNPLKGLVPYQGDARSRFPHSMEFSYLPYSALVKGYAAFDWQPLETVLDAIASRGHQAVVRVFLEYPGKSGAIPDFLINDGLAVTKWQHSGPPDHPPVVAETPDYEDKNLRRSLVAFLAAFGEKYDGDPRLGFVTAGLLGSWGEWHCHPRAALFASKAVQTEVMAAYEAAFKFTPVLLRYPTGAEDDTMAMNSNRGFGYHDDSFAWATLHTGRKQDQWFFMTALMTAGPEALAKWRTHPIGGEIRPEAWGIVFDAKPDNPAIQDIRACVEQTHATWMMDSGMFDRRADPGRIARAESLVRRMGYEFHVPDVTIGRTHDGKLAVSLRIENRGVAPIYHDWRPEYGLLAEGRAVMTSPCSGRLAGLLPATPARVWTDTLAPGGIRPGNYTLALRVPNPLKSGKPIRFANKSQDSDSPGWLSLGTIALP